MSGPRPGRLVRDALAAWRAGVGRIAPTRVVEDFLDRRPEIRSSLQASLVVATGKAAVSMVRGLGPAATGFCLVPSGHDIEGLPSSVTPLFGGHPIPTLEGLDHSRRIIAEVEARVRGDSRLLYLVSGGTSALFEVPHSQIPDADLIETYRLLFDASAPIDEVNLVRSVLSTVKAGGLGRAAEPASVLTLAVSDVVGDDPGVIGSGPTVERAVSSAAARHIAVNYGFWDALPHTVRDFLESEDRSSLPTRPTRRSPEFHVLAGIADAEDAAESLLEERHYELVTAPVPNLSGDVAEVAYAVAMSIKRLLDENRRAAFVVGGETTIDVPTGAGAGGRNQHLAALVAGLLVDIDGFACISAGTDGIDGNSTAAGAVVDGSTVARAKALGVDLRRAVERFDTAPLYKATGDAVVTGPTGTNAGDLLVVVVGSPG